MIVFNPHFFSVSQSLELGVSIMRQELNCVPNLAEVANPEKKSMTMYIEKAKSSIKAHPWHTVAILGVVAILGYLLWNSNPSKGMPVAQAYAPSVHEVPNTNSRVVSYGQVQEIQMTVLSAKRIKTKDGDKLLLNNTPDYRQATQTVVVDLKFCPSLAGFQGPELVGRTITAKGQLGAYNGRNGAKPQITVTNADDLRFPNSNSQNQAFVGPRL